MRYKNRCCLGSVPFKQIIRGEGFTLSRGTSPYMRVDQQENFNTVNLETGLLSRCEPIEIVVPLKLVIVREE